MQEHTYSDQYIDRLKERFPELGDKTNDDIAILLSMNDKRHYLNDGSLAGIQQKNMSMNDINIPEGLEYLRNDELLNTYVQSFFTVDKTVKENPQFQEVLCADTMHGVIEDIRIYPDAFQTIRELKSFQTLCKSNGYIRGYIREFGQRMIRDKDAIEKFLELESDKPFLNYCNQGGDMAREVMIELVMLKYRGLYDEIKSNEDFLSMCRTGYGYEIKKFIEENHPYKEKAVA